MDFAKLIELLGDNTEAVGFVKTIQTKQDEDKANLQKLADEVDSLKPKAKDAQKWEDEAKKAFEMRDKIKEQLASKGDDPDKELLQKIEAQNLTIESLNGQILERDRNSAIDSVLNGMTFKGDPDLQSEFRGILRDKLSKGLVKKDDLGFVYVDDSGNPKRNPSDVSKFLTPKDMIETESMKKFIGTITGVPSSGDGFAGGEVGTGSEGPELDKLGQVGGFDQLMKLASEQK